MKPQGQYGCVELKVNTLQIIWLKHTGFLEKIAQKHRVMICYADDRIYLTGGNKKYCEIAQREIDSIVNYDYTMQLHVYDSDDDIKFFIRLFSNQDYRNFCLKNKGFWIYNKHSLVRYLEHLEKDQDYKGKLPSLPQYFVLIWLQNANINEIKEKINTMVGYNRIDWDNFGKWKQQEFINVTHMEAISIFLTLDIEQIELEQQVSFELIQHYEQFTLIIRGSSQFNVDKSNTIIQNHLTKRFFSPFYHLGTPLNCSQIDQFQKELNEQVKSQANWKLFIHDDIEKEATRLDGQFRTNLHDFIASNKRGNEQIYIFGDKEKQKEISDKMTLLIRQTKWNNPNNSYSSNTNSYANLSTNSSTLQNTSTNKFSTPYQAPLKNYKAERGHKIDDLNPQVHYQSQYKYPDNWKNIQGQFSQNTNNYSYQYHYQPKKEQGWTKQIDYAYQPISNYMKEIQPLVEQEEVLQQQQQDNPIPLRGYKNNEQQQDQNLRNYVRNIDSRKRQFDQFVQYVPKVENLEVPIENFEQYHYKYLYEEKKKDQDSPEEKKISQLIQFTNITKQFIRTIIKISVLDYQINYSLDKKKNDYQIYSYQQSFEEYKGIFYKSQSKLEVQFFSDKIQLYVKVKDEDEVNQIVDIFDKFFNLNKYFVAVLTSTSQQFLDVISLRYEVENFRTTTEQHGYITAEEFNSFSKAKEGKNVAIKVTFTYFDQVQVEQDFQNLETGLAFQQESSILEMSTSAISTKIVIVLPEEQLQFINEKYPELVGYKLSKQGQYLKHNFYYVQVENKQEVLLTAKEELITMNEKLVQSFVLFKKEQYKAKKMNKIRCDKFTSIWKLQLYKNINDFYTKFLNDQISASITLDEYQSHEKKSPFQEITINLKQNRIQSDSDFKLLEQQIFKQDSQYQISATKVIELPKGNFLTALIRINALPINHISELDSENSLIRGYIENHD